MGNCAGPGQQPPSPSPPPAPEKSVLNHPFRDVRATYTIGKELGRGALAVTHICTHKISGKQYACKSIPKRKLVHPDDIKDVQREVRIMNHLASISNIVEFEEAYEDKVAVHLIMELCTGGELFDRIVAQGKYTEQAAASICRAIVQVILACHSMSVMHRDLKPENFLYANKTENSSLKVTDFGVAVFFNQGETFEDLVGSPYYMAPEVLNQHYGPEADIWSAGVILYILLSGAPPFSPDSDLPEDIFSAIKKGNIDLTSSPWPSISAGAKDLLKKMLVYDPKLRLKPRDILSHSWIRVDGEASNKPLDNVVLTRMKQFRAMNKLKRVALKVIANSLSEEEIMGLKAIFKEMDTDGNGKITLDELRQGLAKQGSDLAETEIRQLMETADVDKTGNIDYMEFITATVNMNKKGKEDHLFAAFQYFDRDNSGFITKEELQTALEQHNMMDGNAIKEILEEADTNKDGLIDYEEFAEMMTKQNPTPDRRKRIILPAITEP
ncbi:hypothetical protein GOP47_0021574 [Adiantum capillus-veneris]|uniref:non-specific serine/threonine protein kinase n=1 Tax=Adiantum capillus-veneris TaxID=13818 RepID=A0A9D4U8M5_ADICA|nr:hypothetical protein GOP47_0021574 [Adiantum capillus-veneris]